MLRQPRGGPYWPQNSSSKKGIAEQPLGQRIFNGEEIAVPAAVLKNAEQAVVRLAGGDHLVGLSDAQAHGLVGDDVFASR